jgi:hypothetical protein
VITLSNSRRSITISSSGSLSIAETSTSDMMEYFLTGYLGMSDAKHRSSGD